MKTTTTQMSVRMMASVVLGLVVLVGAPTARAATISFVTTPGTVPTDTVVTVELATDGDALNVVEGSVAVPQGLTVASISTGGSALSLWTQEPKFVPGGRTIEFAGGTPAGLSAHSVVKLFSFTASSQGPKVTGAKATGVAYKSDGKGTPVPLSSGSWASGAKQEGASTTSPHMDTVPPVFVYADVAQDPTLFGGKAYLTFAATDDSSGVAYYEVKEGSGAYEKVDKYYVLHDQSRGSTIVVRAVDVAGNTKEATLIPQHTPLVSRVAIAVAVVLVVVLAVLFVRRRMKRTHTR